MVLGTFYLSVRRLCYGYRVGHGDHETCANDPLHTQTGQLYRFVFQAGLATWQNRYARQKEQAERETRALLQRTSQGWGIKG